MIEIQTNGFTCVCDETIEGKLILKDYHGDDAILDLSMYSNLICIEKKAFLSCKSVKKVILPESITKIGDWAFSKCSNLKSITFKGKFIPNLFGRGVFDDCIKLEKIAFSDSDKDLSILLAMNANKLKADHLLRSDDIGEKSWYEKWDLNLLSALRTDDEEGSISATVCGEEDTSYTGMVDGEMPGETGEYIKTAGKNKCFLCYERMIYSSYLAEETRKQLEAYIKARSFETKTPFAWLALKEDSPDEVDYFKLYLDIVKPDSSVMNAMINDLGSTQVQAKAFLISKATNSDSQDSFFDDLLF